MHPSLRRSRASSPQGRTEPVKVLGGPQRPKAFETLKVYRCSRLVPICHLRVASKRRAAHGVGIRQDTFSVKVLILKPSQTCYHHGSDQSHVGPSLRRSRARSPQGRTEPVKVLGGPQRPNAFETLKVHRHNHLVQIIISIIIIIIIISITIIGFTLSSSSG